MTASPSASPSPTPLSDEELLALIPEGARAENFGSAVNFARFFIDLHSHLFQKQDDPALFERLSTDTCEFCSGALADYAVTKEAAAYNVGGDFVWLDGSVRGGLDDDGYWYITQGYEVSEKVTYLADGTVHSTEAGGTGEAGLKLEYVEGAWSVLGVEIIDD